MGSINIIYRFKKDRIEVLSRIQTTFAREFELYDKLKESDIVYTDYATK